LRLRHFVAFALLLFFCGLHPTVGCTHGY
jgi:hypothetical protein